MNLGKPRPNWAIPNLFGASSYENDKANEFEYNKVDDCNIQYSY